MIEVRSFIWKRTVAFELTLLNISLTHDAQSQGDRCMYLLTFWPPGPEDLLKETSPSLRGIVLAVNEASHFLASDWS